MSRICELCGKRPRTGYHVSHSQKRVKRRFLPNLRKVKVLVGGKMKRMTICTKCLKSKKVEVVEE